MWTPTCHVYRIYICFPGIPTLPQKNATFWKLVRVIFAEIPESVSLYFVQDCLRKNIKYIFRDSGWQKIYFVCNFSRKSYIIYFLARRCQLKVHYLLLNHISRLQETRYFQKHFILHNYVKCSYFFLAKCYKMLFSN